MVKIDPGAVSEESVANSMAEIVNKTEDEAIEQKVKEALDCPCVADLKNSSCGEPFVAAFSCYVRSKESSKGNDCVELFVALQGCLADKAEEFEFLVQDLKESEKKLAEA